MQYYPSIKKNEITPSPTAKLALASIMEGEIPDI